MAGLLVKRLLQSATMKDGIGLYLLGADDRRYELVVDPTMASVLAATILRHAGELSSQDPEQQGQMLASTGLQAAITDTGAVALVFTLEGGAELAVTIPKEAVSGTADVFDELRNAAKPRN